MLKQSPAPLLSVVIPCYNEERYLQRCIDSLMQQSYPKYEVIFVDDGSTDATKSILRAAAKRHKSIRSVSQKNAGPGAARNKGAKLARGSILIFVDADMSFHKDYLKILTLPIRQGKTVGTIHTREIVANPENLWARSWSINRIPEGDRMQGSGVFRAIKRSAFLKAGGFDPSRGYFDDDLSHIGTSTPVKATCYHNNPETLGEAFTHSMWVGRSLIREPRTRKRYTTTIILSFLALAALVVLVILQYWMVVGAVIAIALICFLVFTLSKAIPRVSAENRPEYLFSIPILWLFRMAGYLVGATRQVFS